MRNLAVLVSALLVVAPAVMAAKPPAYFVNEAKLPFGEILGIPTQPLWGVHNNAGYRHMVCVGCRASLQVRPREAVT